MTKVSIIVPIYNTRKYLSKCIESLINQTEKDIEIILINDGSIELIDDIVERYKDTRIKYFKRKNYGIGISRNFGINHSKGEYIMFIDSDDYILPECVSKLYNKIKKEELDLVIGNYYEETENTKIIKEYDFFDNTNLLENPEILYNINLGPCNKIYKRENILKNNVKFEENLKYEDIPFVTKYLLLSQKIGMIKEPLFVYCIHQNSETTTVDKRIFDIFKILDISIKELNKYKISHDSKVNFVVMILSYYILQQKYISNSEDRNKFIDLSFKKLNKLDKNWKKCEYIKKYSILIRIVKTNKKLMKLYCRYYNKKINKVKSKNKRNINAQLQK